MAIRKPSLSTQEMRNRVGKETAVSAKAVKPLSDTKPSFEQKLPKVKEVAKKPVPSPNKSSPPADRPQASCITARSVKIEDEEKEQIFVSVPLPAAGVSKSFDLLRQHYTPERALQLILRKAFDEYRIMIIDGSFKKAPQNYENVPADNETGYVTTSRTIELSLYQKAAELFDPFGFESKRVVGRSIGMSALAAFFEKEMKQY